VRCRSLSGIGTSLGTVRVRGSSAPRGVKSTANPARAFHRLRGELVDVGELRYRKS